MGKVAKQRQEQTPRRGARNWLWLGSLALLFAGTAVLAQTAIEVRELLEWGDNEMALERAEKGLEQNPEDAELKFYHALALARTGKTDDALDAFKELAEQNPGRPEIYNNLAVLYAQQGNYEDARASLEAALNTDPVYSTAHKNLADIYSAQAAAAYNRALARGEQRETPKPELSLLNDWSKEAPAKGAMTASVSKPRTQPKVAEAPKSKKSEDKPEAVKPEAKPAAKQEKPAEEKTAAKVTTLKLSEPAKPVEVKAEAESKPEPVAEVKEPRRPTTLKDVISAAEAAGAKVVYPDENQSGETSGAKKSVDDLKLISTKQEAEAEAKAKDKPVDTAKAETPSKPAEVAPQQAQRAAQAVEDWAAAWRKQDVNAYIAAYADFFRPEDGMKHDAWVAQRRDRVSAPKYIRLTLQNLRIRLKGEGRAIANFRQDYQSDTYQDSVNKALYLERIKGEWRIVREVSE